MQTPEESLHPRTGKVVVIISTNLWLHISSLATQIKTQNVRFCIKLQVSHSHSLYLNQSLGLNVQHQQTFQGQTSLFRLSLCSHYSVCKISLVGYVDAFKFASHTEYRLSVRGAILYIKYLLEGGGTAVLSQRQILIFVLLLENCSGAVWRKRKVEHIEG